VGISLVFTAIMMIVMPAIIMAVGIPEILGGAWMGGTIDSTGAVAAAGAFLGEKAMYVAATIKRSEPAHRRHGILVAIYWCLKVECQDGRKVGVGEIWHRFPKFVLGFVAASTCSPGWTPPLARTWATPCLSRAWCARHPAAARLVLRPVLRGIAWPPTSESCPILQGRQAGNFVLCAGSPSTLP
jgi:uncharacterized membrane protein YadS